MKPYPSLCLVLLPLLLLVACGGGREAGQLPGAPEQVTVTPGSTHGIVLWRHADSRVREFVVYRRAGSAEAQEIGRVPAHGNAHATHSYVDPSVSDPSQYRYSVAAVGAGGNSAATEQSESSPAGWALTSSTACGGTPTSTDSDGDGLSDAAERAGWTVTVVTNTASSSGVDGKLSRDTVSRNVTSDPSNPDSDGDGVCDHDEVANITDPSRSDSDDDGLSDLDELHTWTSSATNIDSDDDAFNLNADGNLTLTEGNSALFDGNEVNNHGTSPILYDSDGDIYSDYVEIIERGPPFNPLIANLPQVQLSLVGTADLTVNIAYSDSSQEAESKSTSLSQGDTESTTDTSSQTVKTWAEMDATVSASAKASFPEGGSFSTSVSVTAKAGVSEEDSNSWSQSSSQSSQETYNDAIQSSRQQGRTVQGGSIGIGVQISNPGEVSYKLSGLAVTALQRDPANPSAFKAIATLDFSGPLASGLTLAPGGQTGVLQVSEDLTAGNVILELMANPSSLLFEVGRFSLSNEAGISYSFLEETTNAQTGLIVIDYGNGNIVRARVATNVQRQGGDIVGVGLPRALEILSVPYQAQTNGAGIQVLTSVTDRQTGTDVAVDSANKRFWTVISTQPLASGTNFEDINLKAGEAVYLLYVTDGDDDGLYFREEYLYGTSDSNADSDGDGLSDFDEVKTGWTVPASLPPLYPGKVFSDPTRADTDNDGLADNQEKALTTDPDSPDTDGDLLCDGPGSTANEAGPCVSGAEQDPEPLVPRFAVIGLSPPANAVAADPGQAIAVSFSLAATPSSSAAVRSLSRGSLQGSFSFSNGGRTLTFSPAEPLKAGEEIEVMLSSVEAEGTRQPLAPFLYRFRTATLKGSGTFGAPRDSTVGGLPISVTAGDFNLDGQLDLAVANEKDGSVSVLLSGTTPGSFQPQVMYPVGSEPYSVTSGDFDGDGRLDLAVANSRSDSVSVLLAAPEVGTFQAAVAYPVGGNPDSVAAGDFDGDGKDDLAVANRSLRAVSVFLTGATGGTFGPKVDYPVGGYPGSVAAGDFDGDGRLDLVTANDDANTVSVLLAGATPGTFRAKVDYPTGESPYAVVAGDFNNDGWLDLATANDDANTVSVLLADPARAGQFRARTDFPAGSEASALAAGDFNGDGRLDLAVANFDTVNISVLHAGPTPGTFLPSVSYETGAGPSAIFAGDFDGDGRLDLAVANLAAQNVSILPGQP